MKFKADPEIDHWLQNLSEDERSKVGKVSKLLKGYHDEIGSMIFRLPLEDLDKFGLDKTSLEIILTKLYQLDIVLIQMLHKDSSPPAKSITTEWLEWPYLEDVILKDNTWIGIESDRFGYLLFKLEETLKKEQPEKYKFNWQAESENRKGVLISSDGTKFPFRSGTFAAINEFFKNDENVTTKDKLKEGMSKSLQGGRKNAKEISISKWKSYLKERNPKFFRYFDIRYIPPDTYKLISKPI